MSVNNSLPRRKNPTVFPGTLDRSKSKAGSGWKKTANFTLDGGAFLLENIDKTGSISAAARLMGLGYRNAWLWITSMNKLAPSPFVEKATGGMGGGYARLTEEARKAIAYYKDLHDKLGEFLDTEK